MLLFMLIGNDQGGFREKGCIIADTCEDKGSILSKKESLWGVDSGPNLKAKDCTLVTVLPPDALMLPADQELIAAAEASFPTA